MVKNTECISIERLIQVYLQGWNLTSRYNTSRDPSISKYPKPQNKELLPLHPQKGREAGIVTGHLHEGKDRSQPKASYEKGKSSASQSMPGTDEDPCL